MPNYLGVNYTSDANTFFSSSNNTANLVFSLSSISAKNIRFVSFANSNTAVAAHWLCLFDTNAPVSGVTAPIFVLRNPGTANAQGSSPDLMAYKGTTFALRYSSTANVLTPLVLASPVFVQISYLDNFN